MTKNLHQKAVLERSMARLKELPEKQKDALTTREAVLLMRDAIGSLRKRGYSFEEIEKHLSEDGIEIKKSAMMSALRPRKKRASRPANKETTSDV